MKKKLTTMNVSLTEDLHSFVKDVVFSEPRYATVSEYIRDLIDSDKGRRERCGTMPRTQAGLKNSTNIEQESEVSE